MPVDIGVSAFQGYHSLLFFIAPGEEPGEFIFVHSVKVGVLPHVIVVLHGGAVGQREKVVYGMGTQELLRGDKEVVVVDAGAFLPCQAGSSSPMR